MTKRWTSTKQKREPSGSPKSSVRRRVRARARRRRPKLKLYAMHWKQRNRKQKSRYRKSLSVLDRVREDNSFSAACREQQISRATARRYLGKALYRDRKSHRIKARKCDRLFRNMELVESGGHILFVELNDSEQATKLSSYHSAIKRFLQGDAEPLAAFKNDGITDSAKVFHKFETSTKKILEMYERHENFPEDYEIYEP